MFDKIAEKLYEECNDKSKGIMDVAIAMATEFDITQGTDSFVDMVCFIREYRNGAKGLTEVATAIYDILSKPTSCDTPVDQHKDLTRDETKYIEMNFGEIEQAKALVVALKKEGVAFKLEDIKDQGDGEYSIDNSIYNTDGTVKASYHTIYFVQPYDRYRERAIDQRADSIAQSWDYLHDLAEQEVDCCGPFESMGMSVLDDDDEGFIVAVYE